MTMNDVLPATVAFVSGALTGPSGVACVISSGTVNCTAIALAPGEEFVLSLTVRATEPGTVTNTATAGSATDDPVPDNNAASVETLVFSEG